MARQSNTRRRQTRRGGRRGGVWRSLRGGRKKAGVYFSIDTFLSPLANTVNFCPTSRRKTVPVLFTNEAQAFHISDV